jgi:hypothetical protein
MKNALFLLIAAAAACGSSSRLTSPAPNGLAAAVVGTWNLTQACGGIAYICHAPGSLSAPNQVVFRADGTMDLYRSGATAPVHGTYTLVASKTDSLRAGSAILTPGLEGATDTLTLNFSIEGELILAEPCCDRLAYSFVKQYPPD